MVVDQKSFGIHWFRRDLRVAGNPALRENWKKNNGRVLGIFAFDQNFLAREDFSNNRFQFFLETLKELKSELIELGGDLLVLDIGPKEAFSKILDSLNQTPDLVTWNEDHEPFAVKRDKEMRSFFEHQGVETLQGVDHVLVRPNELTRPGSQEGYKVFTPFSKRWLEIFEGPVVQKRLQIQREGLKYLAKKSSDKLFDLKWKEVLSKNLEDHLENYLTKNQKKVDIKIPKAGSFRAYEKLQAFDPVKYDEQRDTPSIKGTSQFSPFIKNGSLTITQIIAHYDLKPYSKKNGGRDVFFSELIWREFYYHLLARNPEVENQEFVAKYRGLKWSESKEHFNKWKEGKTGYPIVDAGMRQLNQTGWMHNRVRMIVASFLTKHLLINWRWGEQYFMEKLIDGDLAPNNGGWQWASSTGCDAQPYFRVFNPWLQSKRFDPLGEYILNYIPELKNLNIKDLHAPITGHESYPAPIVEHSLARKKAIEFFKYFFFEKISAANPSGLMKTKHLGHNSRGDKEKNI
jgi:deoxyribodipyrimidine photo-lyase